MAEELDEQGNPIVDPPDPVVTVTAERDEMAGRAEAAEARAKDAQDLARQGLWRDTEGNIQRAGAQPEPRKNEAAPGLSEEEFYDIQSDPVKFMNYVNRVSDQRSTAAVQAAVRELTPLLDQALDPAIARQVDDWDDVKSDVLAKAKEFGIESVSALRQNPKMLDLFVTSVRGDRAKAGKYNPVISEEEVAEEVADDVRSAMLAHGTAVGGASRGSKSEWDGFSKDEIAIAKQDGLKPDEFRERYLKNDPGDFVNMPRKKAANAS